MVSLTDSQIPSSPSPCSLSVKIQRSHGRSMRTIRSNLFQSGRDCSPERGPTAARSAAVSEVLTDSVVDFRLIELTAGYMKSEAKSDKREDATELLELSRDFSDFSSFNSDISGELQRLASVCDSKSPQSVMEGTDSMEHEAADADDVASTEILDFTSPEEVEPVVKSCAETLMDSSSPIESKRTAAAKIRLLAKHRSDFRELIGLSGAIQSLIPLLRSTDPAAQENAVTALLNLSLQESNKNPITDAGAIKPLVYALRTGTSTAKQNAACALLNLSMIEDNRITIGVCGAIPPLVSLMVNGSSRGKKDALTTMYKLCSARQNKERAVSAGAVAPLVGLVSERSGGVAEKAMVVLNSLAAIGEGREAIVQEGGIPALVEAIEDGPAKGKEFAVLTLLQLCADSARNRGLLVREGAIPPLVALSQSGSARAKHKAETLLGYLREAREEGGGLGANARRMRRM
ncbi:U-box domain-containing protein 4-like [Phalaenopsis equestris]|uniref:U-box domain-containing protein 4-like n=1 Tax=Phalaenopsis equestris TaxID=78828 RepID=UPI0009E392A1|nr:U-box domain-containing protein 4-like [Phalaenopsis equestris]